LKPDNDDVEELPPSQQPGTDDPWVVVTPVQKAPQAASEAEPRPKRRRWPCPVCGAYWGCEHDA